MKKVAKWADHRNFEVSSFYCTLVTPGYVGDDSTSSGGKQIHMV